MTTQKVSVPAVVDPQYLREVLASTTPAGVLWEVVELSDGSCRCQLRAEGPDDRVRLKTDRFANRLRAWLACRACQARH